MKKFVTILMIGIMLLYSVIPAYGDNGDIKISAEIGFDKVYRTGFITPVTITVENNMKDIDGEIQIEIPSSAGPMGVDTVNVYAIEINHPKNTVKKYTMNIPIPSSVLNTKLKIVEDKKILIEQYIRIDRGIAENVMLAGVMSDNPSNLNYLSGFTFKNLQGSAGMTITDLDEKSFSTDLDVMNSFNVIFMNDYDSSKLSEAQYVTLKSWVEQGGFLIIGTGPNAGKTLSIFKDEFMTGEKGSQARVSAKGLGTLAGTEFSELIDVVDIKAADGDSLVSENGIDLVQQLDKGNGRILLLAFDLGLEPVSSWSLNRYFVETLLQRSAPSAYSGQYFEKYMAMGRNYAYSMDRALRNIPELPLPGYKTIIVLFAVYILLAAPVSYIMLKKKDKRELMWAVVPALSFVFAAFIYFVGFGTRLTRPVFNKISIIHADDTGRLRSESFGGIFTPNKDDLKVEGVDGTQIRPLINRGYYDNSYQNWEDKKIETKITLSPKTSIEFYDVGVWSMKTLSLRDDEEKEGRISSEIRYMDSGFSGFVENSTDFDLEDCYIVSSYQYMDIGDIKRSEKKEIKGDAKQYYGNRYDLLESIYSRNIRRNNGQNLTNDQINQLRIDNQRRDILDYYFDGKPSEGIEGIKLIGWTKASMGGEVKVNGKDVRIYEKSLIVADMKLVIEHGGEIELPWGYVKPKIKQNFLRGGYEASDNMVFGTGTIEVSYDIGGDIEPNRISLSNDKIEPNVRQFIWNVEKNDWESGDFSSFVIQGKGIDKYLDKNNMLRFKFELNESNFRLPQISVKGSVK